MKFFKRIEANIRRSYKQRSIRAQLKKTVIKSKNPASSILITGGLGDVIVVARYWRDFVNVCGDCEFDVYYANPALATLVFKNVPGFRAAYPDTIFSQTKIYYEYAFRLNQFIYLEHQVGVVEAFLGSQKRHLAVTKVMNNVENRSRPIQLLVNHHPYMDGALGSYARIKQRDRSNFLHYLADLSYGGDTLDIPDDPDALGKFGLAANAYISIHNGYDENMASSGRLATKAYPHWDQVVAALRRLNITLPFVQIGAPATSKPIAGVDKNLIGMTNLAQAMTIVGGSAFHLDNEGGFVHVAAAKGRRSCVVFGPTSVDYFGYSNNINIRPNQCGDCWWSEPGWMVQCPRGHAVPVCMESHDAESIAAMIAAALNSTGAAVSAANLQNSAIAS